jgi:transcriptional pleiotropic regulator of transition state genes
MKATGIVRKIDSLGRIVIPKELRRIFKIAEGDAIEIYTEDENKIILTKYNDEVGCIFCGERNGVISFEGKPVCSKCIAMLKK